MKAEELIKNNNALQNIEVVGDNTKVRTTTKVTGKGQIYFVNKFLYMNQNT